MVLSKNELLKLALQLKPNKEILEKKSKSELIEYLFGVKIKNSPNEEDEKRSSKTDTQLNDYKRLSLWYEQQRQMMQQKEALKQLQRQDIILNKPVKDTSRESIQNLEEDRARSTFIAILPELRDALKRLDEWESEKNDSIKLLKQTEERLNELEKIEKPMYEIQQQDLINQLNKWNNVDRKIIEDILEKSKNLESLILNLDLSKFIEINDRIIKYEFLKPDFMLNFNQLQKNVFDNTENIEKLENQYIVLTKTLGPLEIIESLSDEMRKNVQNIETFNSRLENSEKVSEQRFLNIRTTLSKINQDFDKLTSDVISLQTRMVNNEMTDKFEEERRKQQLSIVGNTADLVASQFDMWRGEYIRDIDLFRQDILQQIEVLKTQRPFELRQLQGENLSIVERNRLDLQAVTTELEQLRRDFSDNGRRWYEELYNEFYKKYMEFLQKVSERNRKQLENTVQSIEFQVEKEISSALDALRKQPTEIAIQQQGIVSLQGGKIMVDELQNRVSQLSTRIENVQSLQGSGNLENVGDVAINVQSDIDDLDRRISRVEKSVVPLTTVRNSITEVIKQLERISPVVNLVVKKNDESIALRSRAQQISTDLTDIVSRVQTLSIQYFSQTQLEEAVRELESLRSQYEQVQTQMRIVERDKIPVSVVKELLSQLETNIENIQKSVLRYENAITTLKNISTEQDAISNMVELLSLNLNNSLVNINYEEIMSLKLRTEESYNLISKLRDEYNTLTSSTLQLQSGELTTDSQEQKATIQRINNELQRKLTNQLDISDQLIAKLENVVDNGEKTFKKETLQLVENQTSIFEKWKIEIEQALNSRIADFEREKQNFQTWKENMEKSIQDRLNDLKDVEEKQRLAILQRESSLIPQRPFLPPPPPPPPKLPDRPPFVKRVQSGIKRLRNTETSLQKAELRQLRDELRELENQEIMLTTIPPPGVDVSQNLISIQNQKLQLQDRIRVVTKELSQEM